MIDNHCLVNEEALISLQGIKANLSYGYIYLNQYFLVLLLLKLSFDFRLNFLI